MFSDVLKLAGAPQGEKLRGWYQAMYYLEASGTDGDAVLFAMPEVDLTFTDANTAVAYLIDIKPLLSCNGPL